MGAQPYTGGRGRTDGHWREVVHSRTLEAEGAQTYTGERLCTAVHWRQRLHRQTLERGCAQPYTGGRGCTDRHWRQSKGQSTRTATRKDGCHVVVAAFRCSSTCLQQEVASSLEHGEGATRKTTMLLKLLFHPGSPCASTKACYL